MFALNYVCSSGVVSSLDFFFKAAFKKNFLISLSTCCRLRMLEISSYIYPEISVDRVMVRLRRLFSCSLNIQISDFK